MKAIATLLITGLLLTGCYANLYELRIQDDDSGLTIANKVAQRTAWCIATLPLLCLSEWDAIPASEEWHRSEIATQRWYQSATPQERMEYDHNRAFLLGMWALGGGPSNFFRSNVPPTSLSNPALLPQAPRYSEPWITSPYRYQVLPPPVSCSTTPSGDVTWTHCY